MRPARPFLFSALALASLAQGADDLGPAQESLVFSETGNTSVIHEFSGSGSRQNPFRQALATPFEGDTLFVRFWIRYGGTSIDVPPKGDGEFFVFWLDANDGGERATHSGGVPNLGIHVKEGKANHFMARFTSGQDSESFAVPLVGDRDTLLVGRLSKSMPGIDQPFDKLDLWVDPRPDELGAPHATSASKNGKVSRVNWIGFSTGGKTEPEDIIQVRDLLLTTRWESVFSKSSAQSVTKVHRPQSPRAIAFVPLKDAEIPDPPAYSPPPPPSEIAEVKPPPVSVETDHWAFQAMSRPEIPKVANAAWVRTPIDAFIARFHEEQGLSPAPPAESVTLVRRIALVMTGLPPESEVPPADLDAFAESLLESPAYGERWGRHWLDVARWAESNGHQHNRDRDHAWRYRDWVIGAFNDDKPYDAFLREQIAGDEIEPYAAENVVATGFLSAARYSGNELDKDIQRNDILVDIVNTTSKAFLGLTMECAQCHDHFFDPITQWDYYRMQAFFAQGQPGDAVLDPDPKAGELIAKRWGLFESVRDRMVAGRRAAGNPEPVLVIPKSVPGGMTPAEKAKFAEIETAIDRYPKAWAYYSPVTSPHHLEVAPNAMRWPLPFQKESLQGVQVRFLERGDPAAPGPVATAAWPQVFGPMPESIEHRPRLALANWLTNPEHPLTARVWVNRIWQGHFGRGLVASSGDFGKAGDAPSHPELLDWLARELIESGWSTKHIHRLILQSNTFRQSSLFSASNADRDPDNAGLWRWKPRRLEAEAVRDSLLATAGILETKFGGPSVPLSEAESSHRRSLYLQQKRDNLPHQQMLFDGAGAVTSCSRRHVSTTGLQPLWMLNSEFMQGITKTVADQLAHKGASAESLAKDLIKRVYRRPGDAEEIERLTTLIRTAPFEDAVDVILNTNEFVYVP